MSQSSPASNKKKASPGPQGNELNHTGSPVRRIRALISGTAQNYRDLSPFKFKAKARVLNPELSVDSNSGASTTEHMASGSSALAAITASEQLESILKREANPAINEPAVPKFTRPNTSMNQFRNIVADANYTFGGLTSKIFELKNDQKALEKELMKYLRNAHGLMDQIADVLDDAHQTKTSVETESEAYQAFLKSEENRIAELKSTMLEEEFNSKEVTAKMKLQASKLELNIAKMQDFIAKLGEEIEELKQGKDKCIQEGKHLKLDMKRLRDEAVELKKSADDLELKRVNLKQEVTALDDEKRTLVAQTAWWTEAKNEHHRDVMKMMDQKREAQEHVDKEKDEKMNLGEASAAGSEVDH